tara:strand:+ start:1094 stop:3160 length:2067 start_codon:yes stop_codon:yes gene_type:complete
MTFLSPSVFWLLGAISIPIAIHLLNLLRLNKVEFSSIQYIKKLKTSSIRKIKIKKLILLLLRILIITCLVMMMAQPVTQGFMPGWISAEQDSKLVILIDNSASMSSQNGEKSYLEQSKNLAMALVSHFGDKTNITISQTCPPKVVFSGIKNDEELRNTLKSIKTTASHDNLWKTISNNLLENDFTEPIKECVVFSDMMHLPDSSFLKRINDFNKWKFYFVKPEPVKNNIGVLNVSPANRIKSLGQLIKLDTRVKNSGKDSKLNVPLELLFNEQRVGQVVSQFESQKEKEFLFQAYPIEAGILESKIILPKDDYQFDNRWYLSMPIMDEIRCSIIGSDTKEIAMLEMILRSIDPSNELLKIDTRIQPNISRLFLDDIDVVLIHNPTAMSNESIKDLDQFLKEGGGVLWFQGNKINSQYDPELFSTIGFPDSEILVKSGQGIFETDMPYERSDIIQDIKVRDISKELPEVFQYVKVIPNSEHKVHLALNNNDPFLMEFHRGSGTVFYFSSLLDLEWNDLPIRGVVVPLLYKLIILSGTDEINTSAVLINEHKWISIEESKLTNKWEVVSPSGVTEMIVPEYDKEGIMITGTNELGIYQVYSNGENFTSFPTRLHYKEYIQKHIQQSDVESIFGSENIRWLKIEDNFAKIFAETRHGKSLWKFFLIAAIILLLIETIVGRPLESLKGNDSE